MFAVGDWIRYRDSDSKGYVTSVGAKGVMVQLVRGGKETGKSTTLLANIEAPPLEWFPAGITFMQTLAVHTDDKEWFQALGKLQNGELVE